MTMPLVLIVDDELPQRTLIRETLASDPTLAFVEAEDGSEALQQARAKRPDVIILDIMMPHMDGYQVCRILKADPDLTNVPVIFLSALGHAEDKVTGQMLGAFAFVNKPFEELDLQTRVRSALAEAK